MGWDGSACCRSLRSDAGYKLGAAPSEKEAEFPAVCSGGRGLLTPRKTPPARGGKQYLSIGSGFLSHQGIFGGLVNFILFLRAEGVGQQTEQSGTRRG